jgi:hypothetical protein
VLCGGRTNFEIDQDTSKYKFPLCYFRSSLRPLTQTAADFRSSTRQIQHRPPSELMESQSTEMSVDFDLSLDQTALIGALG